jgi:hypothetical protein
VHDGGRGADQQGVEQDAQQGGERPALETEQLAERNALISNAPFPSDIAFDE